MENEIDQIVYVVDDDADVRDSLTWLLESIGLNVVACESALAFIETCPPEQSGCVIMDVRMPGLSGLSAQQRLPEHQICIPLIMMSAHGDIDMAVTAMTQGAQTFLEKPFNDQLLLDQVQTALDTDRQRCAGRQQQQQIQHRYNGLTRREKQVFDRIINGLANQEVADDLAVSRKTVEGHRANVMKKMAASSLADLIQMAVLIGQVNLVRSDD
ncbi:MAG: response regulator [Oceanobacter sp.]|jgi:FixJ family two-component response regulator